MKLASKNTSRSKRWQDPRQQKQEPPDSSWTTFDHSVQGPKKAGILPKTMPKWHPKWLPDYYVILWRTPQRRDLQFKRWN